MKRFGEFITEAAEPQRMYVHYTDRGAFLSIKRRGLKPSNSGNLGPGVYFWVSKSLRPSDLREDDYVVRIKPSSVPKLLNTQFLDELDIGDEFVIPGKVGPQHLEWFDGDGRWISCR